MAEVDRFGTSDELYSIVIVGSMNPAIHHPRWYLAAGLLSEAEVAAAESQGKSSSADAEGDIGPSTLFCSENFSQFTTGVFRIVCLQQNWTIMTKDRAAFDRARDICSGVFQTLPHTPVSAYGFNFAFHKETGSENVGGRLAIIAEKLPLGMVSERGANDFASFHYHSRRNGNEMVIAVEPSIRGSAKLFVGVNTTHQIKVEGLFDLGPMLLQSFAKDRREAEELSDRAVSQFKQF